MGVKQVARTGLKRMLPGAVGRYRTLRYVEQTLASVAGPSPGPETVATRPRNVAGNDLRAEAQRVRVQQWASNSDLFEQLRADRQINTWYSGGNRLHNSYYPTPDAECYASMIGEVRPNRIVEVGGGYSTLIARKAMNYFEHDCELVVVDPAPRTDVAGAADTVVRQPVERAGVEALFDERTILFIDSSHVTRIGGDIPFLYGQLIPTLPADVFVHVHDMYLPYDYPDAAAPYFWTEQYLVEALLSYTPRYRVELTTHFLSLEHSDVLQAAISPAVGRDPLHYGAALWFRITTG